MGPCRIEGGLLRIWEEISTLALRLLRRLGVFGGRVWALGAEVWDLTTRVQEH